MTVTLQRGKNMIRLEDIKAGISLKGLEPASIANVVAVLSHSPGCRGFGLVFLDRPISIQCRNRCFPAIEPLGRPIAERLIMPERWLSVDEIAAHHGVNPDAIHMWITRRRMSAHKVGRLWTFLSSEVGHWVKGGLNTAT